MATENKYEKGDWVRVVDNAGAPRHYEVGEVCKVEHVSRSGLVSCVGKDGNMYEYRFEPWQPKVGERVRVPATTNTEWVGEGEVIRVPEWCVIIKMLTGGMKGAEGGFYAHQIEPVTDTLPVAEQPAALTIQAGRFYKTRDGRKVGPMVPYTDNLGGWEYKWTNTPDPDRGRLWREDGTSGRGLPEHDLIAEWVDTPTTNTAAQVDTIADEYGPVVREVPVQKAKFKVGDVVVGVINPIEYVVLNVRANGNLDVRTKNDWQTYYNEPAGWFKPTTPPTPAIVCKLDKGQPLPAHRPHVHATVAAADKEAARLAELHTGQEFGVFALTGAPHRVAKVYEHEWQRLADAGEKVQAIKALRNMAALDLVTAKRAVEVFVDKAA